MKTDSMNRLIGQAVLEYCWKLVLWCLLRLAHTLPRTKVDVFVCRYTKYKVFDFVQTPIKANERKMRFCINEKQTKCLRCILDYFLQRRNSDKWRSEMATDILFPVWTIRYNRILLWKKKNSLKMVINQSNTCTKWSLIVCLTHCK